MKTERCYNFRVSPETLVYPDKVATKERGYVYLYKTL